MPLSEICALEICLPQLAASLDTEGHLLNEDLIAEAPEDSEGVAEQSFVEVALEVITIPSE